MPDSAEYIDMNPLFYPETIAVIGVSRNPVGGIKYVFANEEFEKKGGKIYPINPKYTELFGRKIYGSLFDPDVPDIDLAVISVPARYVPEVVRDCGKKGVKFAVIYSSGFAESGNYELQRELEKAVEEARPRTRFIGPNCLGVNNPYSGVAYYPGLGAIPGNISYVSMSGGNTARLTVWLGSQGIGFHNVVSIGNSVDLTPTDFINYFRHDPKTEVIALYLESVPDGRRFIEAIKNTTPVKPVILWKGGRTETGKKATQSHTGGLAGNIEIWNAVAKQYGIIMATHFEEFADLVSAFALMKHYPENENVGIVVAGGGISVEYTDLCEQAGLRVPELSDGTKRKLAEIFPDVNTSFRNPVDLGEYGYIPDYFTKALKVIASDPNLSSVIFVREPERFKIFGKVFNIPDMQQRTIGGIKKALENIKKPVFCSPSANSQSPEAYKARHNFKVAMIKEGLPVIEYIPNAYKIISEMIRYRRYLIKIGRST